MNKIFDTLQLEKQIEVTISELENKEQNSNEPEIQVYLKKYREALKALKSYSKGSSDEDLMSQLKPLLNCARGYLETSSDYYQNFLNEMAKTESLIKSVRDQTDRSH